MNEEQFEQWAIDRRLSATIAQQLIKHAKDSEIEYDPLEYNPPLVDLSTIVHGMTMICRDSHQRMRASCSSERAKMVI